MSKGATLSGIRGAKASLCMGRVLSPNRLILIPECKKQRFPNCRRAALSCDTMAANTHSLGAICDVDTYSYNPKQILKTKVKLMHPNVRAAGARHAIKPSTVRVLILIHKNGIKS